MSTDKQLTGFAESPAKGFLVLAEPTAELATSFGHSSQEVGGGRRLGVG